MLEMLSYLSLLNKSNISVVKNSTLETAGLFRFKPGNKSTSKGL